MKKKEIILYIVVMLILLTTSVYATISAELGFKVAASSNYIHPGDEFSITLTLNNVETTGKIKAVEGYIDIDESVLNKLTIDSIKTEDGKVKIDDNNILTVYDAENISSSSETGIIFNTNPASKEGDYKVVINFANPIDDDTDLITLNFKVRDDAEPGEHSGAINYKIFKLFSDDAKEKKELASRGIKLVINKAGDTSSNNTAIDDDNVVDNKTTNNSTNNVVNNTANRASNNTANKANNNTANKAQNKVENKPQNSNNNQQSQQQGQQQDPKPSSGQQGGTSGGDDSTVAPGNLPKAGYKIVILPLFVIAVLGFVFYRKYSKYNYHG